MCKLLSQYIAQEGTEVMKSLPLLSHNTLFANL